MKGPFWLDPADPAHHFPPVEYALQDPDGLLAAGGDLSVARLISAYRHGIFPWYSEGQPILWWSPDPRSVLYPEELKISRSLAKSARNRGFQVSLDRAFEDVIRSCASPRDGEPGTWITREMQSAYIALHEAGTAHSAEAWLDGQLVGGLYGVAVGRIFFGESMFTTVSDGSKVAFMALCRQLERWGFPMIDCQVHSGHLESLGARKISRQTCIETLNQFCGQPGPALPWSFDSGLLNEMGLAGLETPGGAQ